jgi:hypothetical protein
MGAATMTIDIPAAKASGSTRKPEYISTGTQSLAVTPAGAARQVFALTPRSPNCTTVSNGGSDLSCTVQISAPVAQNESFVVSTYGSTDGSGTPLSTATLVANVVLGQNNVISATLSGVVASLSVSINGDTTVAGTTASIPVNVTALDAAGETILGPGKYVNASGNPLTIALASSDAAKTTLSPASVTTPGQAVTLSYNGKATQELYVSERDCGCIEVFGPSATFEEVSVSASTTGGVASATGTLTLTPAVSGNVAPVRTIDLPSTGGLGSANAGIAIDPLSGNLYAVYDVSANSGGPFILVYNAKTASGSGPEIRSIAGSNTGLSSPEGLAVDATGNLYVANSIDGPASVTVYAPGASGNATPIRTISGTNTALVQPTVVAVNGTSLAVASQSGGGGCAAQRTLTFPLTANGNVTPTRNFYANCAQQYGMQFDGGGNLYEGVFNSSYIQIYGPSANGDTPTATYLQGSNTQLVAPRGLVFDGSQYLYSIVNEPGTSGFGTGIVVFAPGAIGNIAPVETISGSSTGLVDSLYLAIGP